MIGVASCSNDEPSQGVKNVESKAYVTASRSGTEIAASTGVFGLNLMAAMNDGNGNVVVSPFNAAMNLSMLCNGVQGEALREMLNALGFAGYDQSDVNYYFNNVLVNGPKADNNTKMSLHNAVWITNFVEISPAAKSSFINDYLSDFYEVSNDAFNDSFRQWVARYSNGQLNSDDLFGIHRGDGGADLTPASPKLSMASALTFESKWHNKFDKSKTAKGSFTNLSKTTSTVDFMHQTYQGSAVFGDTYTIVTLELGNRQYHVALILPDQGIEVNTALTDVAKIWEPNIYSRHCEGRTITISLPKFAASKATDLTDAFKTMGVNKIFSHNDDINGFGLLNEIIAIDQLCAIEFDEEGAKVQSATKTDVSMPIEPSHHPTLLTIDFNRPFAMVIYDMFSMTPLAGAVINQL